MGILIEIEENRTIKFKKEKVEKIIIMDEKQIERINELARKAKTEEGLTEKEKEEQVKLRQEYIASVRMNLRGQLDNIDIEEEDGTVVNLGEKFGDKKTH